MLGLSFGFMWVVSMYQMWIGKNANGSARAGSEAIG